MDRYRVQWNYRSGIGAFTQGSLVELDRATAEAINRDSPGVLVRELETPPEPQEGAAQPNDRMQRGRKDRQGDPSDQGAMTRETFAAVKPKRGGA